MLARRLPGLLPPLTPGEAIETTAIHSAWGARQDVLITTRPFRSPHHTASDAALVGGGTMPRPGEVSLAHNGILFLDELPEFRRRALDALREPLEERAVSIARVRGTLRLPARFQLVAAMNPCPCGFLGDRARSCACTLLRRRAYRGRVSGPLLDRIDLQAGVGSLSYAEMTSSRSESTATVARRVARARALQEGRTPGVLNADLDSGQVRSAVRLDGEGRGLLEAAVDRFGLTGRAHDRLLRVARTLADLGEETAVTGRHIAEALQFRQARADTE
jgi:magnesium chelatase family protein